MRRVRKRWAGLGMRHHFRPRHVGDIQDEEPVMPVADIEAIAHAQRMMTTRRGPVVPRIRFSSGLPLPGDPPPPHLDRAGGIGEIEDHHDVADIALGRRRQISVAAVEIVAVHTAAGGAPLGDQLRRAGARDVIDCDAAAELGRSALAQPLVVDDHDAVCHPHLVGMPALRQIDSRELAGLARIGHVHDRGAARPVHVPDEERRALDPNLPCARAAECEMRVVLDRLDTKRSTSEVRGGELAPVPSRSWRARAQAILTMPPAASRPHFLNRWKHFNAGSSLATNRTAGCLLSPLTCSNQEPPGTAKLSKACQSKRLPSMMECPLPSNGATSRLAVCRTGRVFSPGRSTCTKKVMVLNTGPTVSGSTYSIDNA